MTTTTELVPSISITNLLNQRKAVESSLAAAREALLCAHEIVVSIDGATGKRSLYYTGIDALVAGRNQDLLLTGDGGVAEGMKRFDAIAWQHLMHASGLRTLMNAATRDEWDKSLEKGEYPELSAPNIEATFAKLYDTRGEMFDRGVIDCFKQLSWHYKTNLPEKFGKRIVIRFLRSSVTGGQAKFYRSGSLGHANDDRCNKLDDLSRVMHVLDGKPAPDHRHGWWKRISEQKRTSDPDPQDDYLLVKTFRNGNGHVEFKRADLVDRMNKIIAKHFPGALPAPR